MSKCVAIEQICLSQLLEISIKSQCIYSLHLMCSLCLENLACWVIAMQLHQSVKKNVPVFHLQEI